MTEVPAAQGLDEGRSLRDYAAVLLRRKWIVAQALVLVPLAALVISSQQQPVYQATAEVLVNRQNLAALLVGTADPGASAQPERVLSTQATLARNEQIARRALRLAGVTDLPPRHLLRNSQVTTSSSADLLQFVVEDRSPERAKALATAYARAFTEYRRTLDTISLSRAREEIRARIGELEKRGDDESPLYGSLVEKEQQLRTLEALQATNTFLVERATYAPQVRPRPMRNVAIGLGLGLVLGIALAFVWEALDTRVRSADEVARRLGLPLLGRLAEPPPWAQRNGRLVMLDRPSGSAAEEFRILRTNFDFFNLQTGARTVMVTSAVAGEGKSTTVANLAVALARSGQRVVLVDLDLRQPTVDRFFGFGGEPGISDVVAGRARLGSPVELKDTESGTVGSLQVLPAGALPGDPGEFVVSPALEALLGELKERADIVLVDAPPLLLVGDAMALSAIVDGILVVTRLGLVRRRMLDELRRVLDMSPAPKLGFVATAAEQEERYGYGYGYSRYAYAYGGGYVAPPPVRDPRRRS